MTVASIPSYVEFAGNGSTTTFAYSFTVDATDEDVYAVVYNTATRVVESTTAGVDGVNPVGGVFTISPAPAVGKTVRIERRTATAQPVDLSAGEALPAESIEDVLDSVVRVAQDVQDQMAITRADVSAQIGAADVGAAAASAVAAAASAVTAAAQASAAAVSAAAAAASAVDAGDDPLQIRHSLATAPLDVNVTGTNAALRTINANFAATTTGIGNAGVDPGTPYRGNLVASAGTTATTAGTSRILTALAAGPSTDSETTQVEYIFRVRFKGIGLSGGAGDTLHTIGQEAVGATNSPVAKLVARSGVTNYEFLSYCELAAHSPSGGDYIDTGIAQADDTDRLWRIVTTDTAHYLYTKALRADAWTLVASNTSLTFAGGNLGRFALEAQKTTTPGSGYVLTSVGPELVIELKEAP